MSKTSDLQQKTVEELGALVADRRAEIRELRFKIATRQESKVRKFRESRKSVARILTVLTHKNHSS